MRSHEDEVNKLERALVEIHRARPDAPVDDLRVTQDVMRDVRQAAGNYGQWGASVALDQLVWRTATIAAAVVLMVTVITAGAIRGFPVEGAVVLTEELESAPLFGD